MTYTHSDRHVVCVDPVAEEHFGKLFRKTFDTRKGDVNLLVWLIRSIVAVFLISWFGSFEHPGFIAIVC